MSGLVDPASVCLTSGGDDIRYRSYVNHRIWAAEAGTDYRLEIGLGPGLHSPYDHKYAVIRTVLPRYLWTVWLDDDVYFTDWNPTRVLDLIDAAEQDGLWGVIAEGPAEPQGHWSRINTGVMILRNDRRTSRMLRQAQQLDLNQARARWNDAEDGLFTDGDQDAIWVTVRDDAELRDGLRIVGHADLNSRPHLIEGALDSVATVHFCGPGDKRARLARFAAAHGLGQELVPEHLLDAYSVRRRERLHPAESAGRELKDRTDALLRRARRKAQWIRQNRRWS